MRIVVDTNVFISACIGRGAASKVIEACMLNRVEPIMGSALFLEYEDVLSRQSIFRNARLDSTARLALLDIFLGKCTWPDIYYRWRPNLRDEGDNHLVELAIAGNANAVVTNNLRDFKMTDLKFDQLRIKTPEDILKELEE
jgi:putative PIN family toxin of toxin-antitoxin system